MTRQFHVLDCPECRFNHDNFACTNIELTRTAFGRKVYGPTFSEFKGSTRVRCHKRESREQKSMEV